MPYVISPVEYDGSGHVVDRAFDTRLFKTVKAAENFIIDMRSRWALYPNIEIWTVPQRNFRVGQAKFVKGFSEFGEYK